MASDHFASFLIVIIDADPMIWKHRSLFGNDQQILLNDIIKQLIIYCHAYSLMHRKNKLAIFGNYPDHVARIFPQHQISSIDDFIPILHQLAPIISDGILNSASYHKLEEVVSENYECLAPPNPSNLANAISQSLCVLNKYVSKESTIQPRILVIQAKRDTAHTYNAIMNTVFSAQKMHVPIDSLVISKDSSNFLQQASFLTKGIYQHPSNNNDVLQILLTHFLASINTRKALELPLQKSVEFKAACACHRQTVEFAFMCSVCLTLVCDVHETCPTCNTSVRKKRPSSSTSQRI